jgi:uncharacterized protein (UPF0248 family)
MQTPFDILNKIKWTSGLEKCEIVILHRGAPDNRKIISGNKIIDIKRDRFWYINREETVIPMHRILEIKLEGTVVWKKFKK